ncbi:(2Fe-2S)-binding protein [Streptomyces sp. NBC_01551]|uniref:(2Fe-2S)-binding protein n=1 Tax=Streptomyces sp. NBC_01551 TaxID=2975876 RepID=UPI00225BD818|nr:(2Fe-2S)-binding protein [Streptomyces sp. NBC_01551]MCX4526091.1 (2Fe-2S)-binding protein [Streptomyces sp. NBC_01551]
MAGGRGRAFARAFARAGRRADPGLDPAAAVGFGGVRGTGRPGRRGRARPGRDRGVALPRGDARAAGAGVRVLRGAGPVAVARDRAVGDAGVGDGQRRPGRRLEPGPGDTAGRRGGPLGDRPHRVRGRPRVRGGARLRGRAAGCGRGRPVADLGRTAGARRRRAGVRRPRRGRPAPGPARAGRPGRGHAARGRAGAPGPARHRGRPWRGGGAGLGRATASRGEAAAGPAAAFAGGHGYAEMPAEAAEPAPAEAAFAGGHGFAEVAAEAAAEPEPGPGPEPEPEPLVGAGVGEPAGGEPVAAEAAGFEAAGFEPAGFEAEAAGAEAGAPAGAAVAAERGEHGFTGSGHAFAEDAESPTPTGDVPAGAETTPDAGSAGGFPAQDPTYDEEVTAPVAHHEHPSASYVLRVNGADRPVTGAWIGESLLYVLRERLGLAGAKDGCSQGECGACAVQVDGRLVASCLVPAATAAGSEVRTVEGLATDGELSDVQQALCRSGAVQCGFCVPGMAMTIHDLLEGNHAPSELETRQALCGNLCRCSGYTGVIDAVREVVAEREATAADADANAEAAASGTEPRIPHQAPPGEGGIHGANGAHGTHGTHGIQHNGGMA